ncbi:ATP-binding protein [Actinacidiphila glaucinigra]|uniref:ATP-binding protein n=1 Tax=Actinacidiphila glaucinigra TaxID=235986 RepID=UPI0037CB9E4C
MPLRAPGIRVREDDQVRASDCWGLCPGWLQGLKPPALPPALPASVVPPRGISHPTRTAGTDTALSGRYPRHRPIKFRLLAVEALVAWAWARDSELARATAQIVAELAANAVTHGRVPGRDIEVRLALDGHVLRSAVSDAQGEQRPQASRAAADSDSGRGLLLLAALASRRGTDPRPHVGKTV